MAETTTLERTIRAVARAGTGFTTAQEPDKWFNLAKGAQLTIPPKGSVARLTLDARGYVERIDPVGRSASQEPPPGASGRAPAQPDTELRLALLQAAAAFLAPRSEAGNSDVVTMAQAWESWIRGAPPG